MSKKASPQASTLSMMGTVDSSQNLLNFPFFLKSAMTDSGWYSDATCPPILECWSFFLDFRARHLVEFLVL